MPGQGRTRRRAPSSRALLLTALALVAVFVTGIGSTPHGPVGTVVYDVVLFNAVPIVAALLCLRAAGRVPEERRAWRAAGTA